EANQGVLAYRVLAVSNPQLFTATTGQPSVDNSGTLTYTLATDVFGTSTFTVVAQDNGGVANGGQDTSAPQTFTITVNLVNHPPSFTANDPPAINENGGAVAIPNWVTSFTPG